MGIDAVLLLRVQSKKILRARLELMGLPASCLDPLDDGAVLLSTMQTFGSEFELRVILAHAFGGALAEMHDDPRGVLVFPDVCEPRARTYDGIVSEVGTSGVWLPVEPPSQTEMLSRMESMLAEVDALVAPAEGAGKTRATAAADAGELAAELERLGHASLDKMVTDVAARAGDDLSFACVLLRATREPGAEGPDDVSDVHRLGDGSLVAVTTRLSTATEMIALSLGEDWKGWLEEDLDPRGACVFSAAHLPAVLAAGTYEDGVRALGVDAATWVKPITVEELLAQRTARARAFLDE